MTNKETHISKPLEASQSYDFEDNDIEDNALTRGDPPNVQQGRASSEHQIA